MQDTEFDRRPRAYSRRLIFSCISADEHRRYELEDTMYRQLNTVIYCAKQHWTRSEYVRRHRIRHWAFRVRVIS